MANTRNSSNSGLGLSQNGDIRKQQGFWVQLWRTQITEDLSALFQDFRFVPCRQEKCLEGFEVVMCQPFWLFECVIP